MSGFEWLALVALCSGTSLLGAIVGCAAALEHHHDKHDLQQEIVDRLAMLEAANEIQH